MYAMCFRSFLEESSARKKRFEIIWPLEGQDHFCFKILLVLHFQSWTSITYRFWYILILILQGETEVDQDAWFGPIEPMPDTHIIGGSVLMRGWDFWIFGGIGNSGEVFNDIYKCKHFWKIHWCIFYTTMQCMNGNPFY